MESLGATALHYAARRGDMEIVELLLSAGADPSLKNDLGQDAAAMCKSFPELRGDVGEAREEDEVAWYGRKTGAVEVLGKENQHSNTDSARDVVDFVGESVDVVR